MYTKKYNQYKNNKKIKPLNIRNIYKYPSSNPIFIAVDWSSYNFIQRLNGFCLLCLENPECYDLNFCYQREIWILHSRIIEANNAIEFGRAIQHLGAEKVFIIAINSRKLQEVCYEKR